MAETPVVRVQDVTATEEALTVDLSDGRSISVPLAWFPRLMHGTSAERSNWRLIGQGVGIHWPALDEDVSVENLLAGRASGEPTFAEAVASAARFIRLLTTQMVPRERNGRAAREVAREKIDLSEELDSVLETSKMVGN